MRIGLQKYLKQEVLFYAAFERYDENVEGRTTVLVKDIRVKDDPEVVTDHVWVNRTSEMKDLNLQSGNIISFYGRVEPYAHGKGSKGAKFGEIDYGISRISDVRVHRQYSKKDDRWPHFIIKKEGKSERTK